MEKYFYGFKPKYVSEEELHLYVTNLMVSLMSAGMNETNKNKFINHLKNMMKDKDGYEREVIKATAFVLSENMTV